MCTDFFAAIHFDQNWGGGVDEFHLYWGDNIVSLSLGGTFLKVQNTNNCFKSSNLITQLQISSHQ